MPHVELPQAEFKAVMLGDTNAGKTSLVLRFAEGYYRDVPRASTVGAFFITKRIQTSNGITCKVQIWDTAGQAQFRAMAPMYYRNAAAAIVCYDVASRRSYKVMKEWLDELLKNVSAGTMVIAIAATKSDLVPMTDPNSLVPEAEVRELAGALGAIFVETSAKTNKNINSLFQQVAERVLTFRQNERKGWVDYDNTGIPVTPGASVKNGKVMKKSPSKLGSIGNGSSRFTFESKTEKHTPLTPKNGEKVGIARGMIPIPERTDSFDAQKSSSLAMCDTGPTVCGIVSDHDSGGPSCTIF